MGDVSAAVFVWRDWVRPPQSCFKNVELASRVVVM